MNLPDYTINGLRFDGVQYALLPEDNCDQWTIIDNASPACGATFYVPVGSAIATVIQASIDKINQFTTPQP